MKVLVTGAASGIGLKLSEALLAQGHTVVATDIRADAAVGFALTPLDVRDHRAWQRLLQEHRDLDALCNVAGVLRPGWVCEAAPEDVALQLDVNVKGLMYGTQAAARVMRARGHGRIVNVASFAGIFPTPGILVYSASKFAVRGYSLAAAAELAEYGVQVSVVCPAGVDTPMLDLQRDREEAAITFSSARALRPDEVVAGILRCLHAPRAPMEVLLPGGSGWLLKRVASSNALYRLFVSQLRRVGRKHQMLGLATPGVKE